jgi:hypothetical protein
VSAERSTILSMVEQARGNNKEISFSEDFARSAIEWYAFFSGRTYPFACRGIKNRLFHKTNLPPSKMDVGAAPARAAIPDS